MNMDKEIQIQKLSNNIALIQLKLIPKNEAHKDVLSKIMDENKSENDRQLIEYYIEKAIEPYQALEVLEENEKAEFLIKATLL